MPKSTISSSIRKQSQVFAVRSNWKKTSTWNIWICLRKQASCLHYVIYVYNCVFKVGTLVMEKKKKKVVLSGNILQELDLSEWSNLCIMTFGLAGDTLWRTPLAISECRWTQLRKILDYIYAKNSLSLLAWVEITSAAWLPHYLFRYR